MQFGRSYEEFEVGATYKQWQELGRQVKRGSTAIYLMRPNLKLARVTDEETGEERTVQAGLRGFGWFPVHGLEDTVPIPGFQGDAYDEAVAAGRAFVATLPLFAVSGVVPSRSSARCFISRRFSSFRRYRSATELT